MHAQTLKKATLALTFWIALHASSLRAQIFTAPLQASTTGTDPVDFEFRADGTLIAMGNYGVGSLLSGDQGAGTRMLWFPSLSAFRAGTITTGNTFWDQSQIGPYSTAFGVNTTASGWYSTAFGVNTSATTGGTTAFGSGSTASGYISIAGGGQLYCFRVDISSSRKRCNRYRQLRSGLGKFFDSFRDRFPCARLWK